jgi:hypothetical protein
VRVGASGAKKVMAEHKPATITLKEFRGMDPLSGEVRVVGGSRTRRGVPRKNRRASCKSRLGEAGADETCVAVAGESAQSSAAHAANCDTDAALAKPNAEDADGAPTKKRRKRRKSAKENGQAADAGASKGSAGRGNAGGPKKPIPTLWEDRAQMDGGELLPEDGVDFVEAVNERIDLVKLADNLLRGLDEKSSKSLLERLLEFRYGKNARVGMERQDGPDKLTWNLPR